MLSSCCRKYQLQSRSSRTLLKVLQLEEEKNKNHAGQTFSLFMQQLEGIKFCNLRGFFWFVFAPPDGKQPHRGRGGMTNILHYFPIRKMFCLLCFIDSVHAAVSRQCDWFQMRGGGAEAPAQITALIRVDW